MLISAGRRDADNEDRLRRVYDPAHVRRVRIDGDAPVRVCVDARMMGVEGTGVATYAQVLARCLGEAGAAPALLRQDTVAARRTRARRWWAALDGRRSRALRPSADAATDLLGADVFREAQVFFDIHQRLMPVACAAPPQVMHWTYPLPLFVEGARNLYTVHDAIPLRDPTLTPIPARRHAALLRRIAERAHRIVTVSEAARADIVAATMLPEGRIVSLSQAVDIPLQPDQPLPAGLASGRYVVACGTIEPRKNLVVLARAHALAATGLRLVIVGPDGWQAPRIRRELAASADVVVLPWQPRAILVTLIRRARALAMVSLSEGFGLPIAEAMTLGTPVIASSRPATAEVAGGAALLVDPGDTRSIAAAIGRVARDDRLVGELRAAGFARAAHFAPHRYARRLRDFYATVADEPCHG